jgi:hypothetical protein
MTFLNVLLLTGMAAGAIPIVIHLFNRRRFRVIEWGAMHLLEEILRTQRRRLKIEQLILLLIRIAIPVVLAICLARPVLTGLSRLAGKAKTSMVLLIDCSGSMNAADATQSRLSQARKEASGILDSLPNGSEITIVWMSGRNPIVHGPSFDPSRARGWLSTMQEGYGTADIGAGLDRAIEILSRAHFVDRELIVLSDFQMTSWSPDSEAARKQGLEVLANMTIPPRITYMRIGKEVGENVAVDSIEVSRPILGVGQTLQIRGNIHNYGTTRYPDLRVYFRADGQTRSVSQVNLGPKESSQVLFSHAFDKAGSHGIEIFAEADALQADNARRMAIPVWDRLGVLLVSGDRNPKAMQAETAYLEIAMQPFTLGAVALADLIRTKTISPEELKPESLADIRVVVLANVRQLSDPQVQTLQGFVKQGGGLLIFAGDRINPDWYNSTAFASGAGLLPCRFGPIVNAPANTGGIGIVAENFDHKALELFNDPRNGNLGGVKIRNWFKLDTGSGGQGVSFPARMESGDSLFAEKTFGQGFVIQCATACDADWSNLPLRPAYLPLIQQLVTYLASTVYPPRNVSVGDTLAALVPGTLSGQNAILTGPDGRRHELKIIPREQYGLAEYRETDRPGLYAMEVPPSEVIHFVVNPLAAESDLQSIAEDEYRSMGQSFGIAAITSGQEYQNLTQQRRFGQEIWKSLLAGVLALVFLEILLQQVFARAGR